MASEEIVYKYPCSGEDCPHGKNLLSESDLYRISHPISLFCVVNPHIRKDKEGDVFMCKPCFEKVRAIHNMQCEACDRWTNTANVVRKFGHVICLKCIDASFPYYWYEDSGKIYHALYNHDNGNATEEDIDLIHRYFARINRFYVLRKRFRSNRQLLDLYMKVHVLWIPTFCEEDIYNLIESLTPYQRKVISDNNTPEALKPFIFRIFHALPAYENTKPECEDDDA
jgi:hypothetical protein